MYNTSSMHTRKRRIPPAFIGALGVFLSLIIAAIFVAPRVVTVVPQPESSDVPSTASIRISFNRTMDQLSVETRLSIMPSLPGSMSWDANTLVFEPLEQWPRGSTITVRLGAGARSTRFLPMLRSQTWTFSVGEPRVVYLWSAEETADLYTRPIDGIGSTRRTQTEHGVLDYTLSGDHETLIYVEARVDGGSDLRALELVSGEDRMLFACPEETRCMAPALSPDENWLAFEMRTLSLGVGGKQLSGSNQVWIIALNEVGIELPVGPSDHVISSPTWSPQGYLTYYDETLRIITLVDLQTYPEMEAMTHIPSEMGLNGSWSPDGAYLIYAEIVFPTTEALPEEEGSLQTLFYSHLYRVEVATGMTVDLSGEPVRLVEDASPVYSPDGGWIAFTRKYLQAARWSLGRQLWIMRSDGTELQQITDDPNYNHSSLIWNLDSSALLYMRKNQADLSESTEIWMVDLPSGEFEQIVVGGYMPQWIP
jgi:hypothetical protein